MKLQQAPISWDELFKEEQKTAYERATKKYWKQLSHTTLHRTYLLAWSRYYIVRFVGGTRTTFILSATLSLALTVLWIEVTYWMNTLGDTFSVGWLIANFVALFFVCSWLGRKGY